MDDRPVRVLLVDDDEDDYILTQALLTDLRESRFELAWVATYDAAMAAIKQNQYDVYLLDYHLGNQDGLELLRAAIAWGCKAPIILLTGQGDHEVDVEAMKAGAADYLDKSQIAAPVLERSIRYAIERKRAEQKIQEQAALLDVATDAIMVRDLNNRILFWNKGAERLYGWKATEAIGKQAPQLLQGETAHQFETAKKMVIEQEQWQGELQHITKDNQEVTVQSRWTLVRHEQAQLNSILVVNTDITEKKQLEAQFLRAQRMESIGTLASGIAHDLNNVLAPILMAVQLLQKKLHDQQSQRLLATLEANTKRGADLIKQVLSFARGLEGKHTILQISHIISEIRQIAEETFPKSIEVVVDIPRDLWLVSGDVTQLHQVLMNLCVNARDAMPNGGKLEVTAENLLLDESYTRTQIEAQVGRYILVSVSDTGTGIAPEIIDRIFEPFFTTKELGKGTGLGLSTVTGIVKSHGGFITVSSQLGKGTQFQLYLPAMEAPEMISVEGSDVPTGMGELVLIADDEVTVRYTTEALLESYAYRVITASNGLEAVSLYIEHQVEVSVVLVDMMMPLMDGKATIQTLQRVNPHVKIIAVSGLFSNGKNAEVAGMGIKACLSKPYTGNELLKTLDQVLHSR